MKEHSREKAEEETKKKIAELYEKQGMEMTKLKVQSAVDNVKIWESKQKEK